MPVFAYAYVVPVAGALADTTRAGPRRSFGWS